MRFLQFAFTIAIISVAIMLAAGPVYAGLEDILYEKGQITKEEWLKAKADQEKDLAKAAPPPAAGTSSFLKGIEVKATFYFDFTKASGDSFTADPAHKGLNTATANNNKSLANGFHFTRTYLTLIKRFDEGHHFRLTLDQMVNNVGGNSCSNGAGPTAANCHEAAPFGLSGFSGTGRNADFVKYAYYNHVIMPGLELRVGQHQTPWIEYEEHRWTYRFRSPIMVDEQNFQTSSDMGVSLLGKVLDGKLDYHFAFQNGEGYQNTPDARGFAGLGRVSVEPIKGIIISGFGQTERTRNGIEGFNPQRLLGNIEAYDPKSDRFKVNAQYVWGDDGADVGTPRGAAIRVPSTYNGSTATTATIYGNQNGPQTSIPRFHNGQGVEFWAYYRLPMIEQTRLYGRYYFMKPNKSTTAGDVQSIVFGVSYDYSKYLSFAVDYTHLKETVLGSGTVAGQTILAGTAANGGAGCPTCGATVDYNNNIIGVRMLVAF